ncbi:hypothetical protein V5N11_034665 [Cardamine amara subsp. amara]|uniref:C2H2-type domain-containing protein n=1 Tax=Cardamine amara subsp. amara TaxID=228776 RepID=A0ABD1AE81_CARAN
MGFSKPHKCAICKEIFLTPQDLISHFETFHSNCRHFPTFSSVAAATTTTHHNPNPNRNLNPAFPVRNNFKFTYYRRGYFDGQGRFHKGFPPSPATASAKENHFLQPKKQKLMDHFPATSSEVIRTLPLLCQLEKPMSEDIVTEYGGDNSRSIDLSLRL